MAVRTADDAVPAHCLRTGKNCRAPSGAGMPWPHRDLHGRRFAFDLRRCAGRRTRELARLGRFDGRDVPARENDRARHAETVPPDHPAQLRSTPVCRRLAHDHRGARPSLPARSAQQTASWFRQLADL